MKYIVTGGCGFIGSNIVDKLISNGNEVIVIDNLSSGKKEYFNPKAKFYYIDLKLSPIQPLILLTMLIKQNGSLPQTLTMLLKKRVSLLHAPHALKLLLKIFKKHHIGIIIQ